MQSNANTVKKVSGFNRFLNGVEVVGNKLPDPTIIFIVLTLAVAAISTLGAALGWSVIHPGDGKEVVVFNLLSPAGIQYMLSNSYQNLAAFAPFAIAVPLLMAVGIVDKSGLMQSVFIGLGAKVNRRILTMVVVFIGVCSNFLSDIGLVMLPPLAAMLFMALGRHPIAGMCCAYAAAGCGMSANILIGITDARLSATSQAAAVIIDPNITVIPTSNWYFIAVAAVVLTLVATFVTEKILEPRLGKWVPSDNVPRVDIESYQATALQQKGMRAAGLTVLIMLAVLVIGVVPSWGFLRNADGIAVFVDRTTQLGAIVTSMLLFIAIPGVVYGRVVGTIKNGVDFGKSMAKGIHDIAPFVVLCFFAAQFTSWFSKSNLGIITAVKGAEFLKSIGLGSLPLMLILIIFFSLINLLIPSANAKWAIFAPVFVPMMMLLGYHPAVTQMVYRIGDSITNSITPLLAYMALLIGLVKEYDENAGIGTLMSLLMPYTLFYGLTWVIMFSIWFLLGIPLGPGGAIFL